MIKVHKIVRNGNKLTVVLNEMGLYNIRDIPIENCYFKQGQNSILQSFTVENNKITQAHFTLSDPDFKRIVCP